MKLKIIDYIQFLFIFLIVGVGVLIPMRVVNINPAITYISMAICITTAFIIIFNFFGNFRLIRQIEGEVDKLGSENKKLSNNTKKLESEINLLSNTRQELESEINIISEENKKLSNNTKKLESEINLLSNTQRELEEENKKLSNNTKKLESEINLLSNTRRELEEENEKFRKSNIQLLEIQKHSQQLVSTLMISGDKFTDFGKILEETTNKNLSLTDKLQILTKKLSKDVFEKLDKNHDGILTIDELEN